MLTHKGTQELTTERLRLRRYAVADAQAMFRNYAADERVTRFLSWTPYESVDDVRAFLSARVEEYSSDYIYNWAMDLGGEIIGSISVTVLDQQNHACEIGYCLGHDYWNQGLTSEALLAVIGYLFTEVGMHRIMAKHDADNPASGMVMKRCGMTLEGTMRGHYLQRGGGYSDALVYGILREEYAPK